MRKMAEPENQEKKAPEAQAQPGAKKSLISSLLPWLIMVVAAIASAGAGLGLATLFAGHKPQKPPEEASPQPAEAKAENILAGVDSKKTWYYDIEPVIANLDEPSITRYIRVTLILEISSQVDPVKGKEFIDEKKPLLINWLTIYLTGQALDDIRGDKNLRRIQSEILDAFNEKLFPNAQPMIKGILFKEFAVQ
jgi:flagellar basal body-associated protein FliL